MPKKRKRPESELNKLVREVKESDEKILSLFPSVNFRQTILMPQVQSGMETALRVLLVAAERDYVNENILDREYGVGGDSRHKTIVRLHELGLLSRSELVSEKRRKKFEYRLSAKGVVLCAAFSRIMNPKTFPTLIRKRVSNENLSRVMLILYNQRNDKRNRLLDVLHNATGLNIQLISEEDLAARLLQTDQAISKSLREEEFFLRIAETLIDFYKSVPPEMLDQLKQGLSDNIDFAYSEPDIAKKLVRLIAECITLYRSTEFQVWLRMTRGSLADIVRLKKFSQDIILQAVKDTPDKEDKLGSLWHTRQKIIGEIRTWLREDSYSMLIQTYPETK